MKRIISLLICSVMLSGVVSLSACSSAEKAEDSSTQLNAAINNDNYDVTTSQTNITNTEAGTETESETTTTSTEIIADEIIFPKYTPSSDEEILIQELLLKSKDFFYGYIDCKEIVKCKSDAKFTTTTEIYDNGMFEGDTYEKKWYEIIDGDIMSLADLNKNMKNIFTDNMIENFQDIINYTYYEENNKLYISEYSGYDGSLLGIDTSHITSIGEIDDETLILYMNAFGAGENWGIDADTSEDFTVTLKRVDNGFKIDDCNDRARMFITWSYNPKDDIF